MSNSISNHPRGIRGAFVEYSHGPPLLVVPFQFNPVQLQRSRSLSITAPGATSTTSTTKGAQDTSPAESTLRSGDLRKLHQNKEYADLMKLYDAQHVEVQEETINLEIRLDATDGIDEGDPLAAQLGIAPQLAILEQMVYPRNETRVGQLLEKVAGGSEGKGFSYSKGANPPLILFVWGSRWALPVNINNINITESEFNTMLYPLRATVAVSLTVIEGPNGPYTYSLRLREALAARGMSRLINVADVVIPR